MDIVSLWVWYILQRVYHILYYFVQITKWPRFWDYFSLGMGAWVCSVMTALNKYNAQHWREKQKEYMGDPRNHPDGLPYLHHSAMDAGLASSRYEEKARRWERCAMEFRAAQRRIEW